MTKRITFPFAAFALLLVNISAFAQNNTDFDSRLLTKFSKKEIKNLDQSELDYWTFYLENSFDIVDIPKEKPDAIPSVISLKSLDKNEINVFKLGLNTHEFARDYIRIDETNKMIVILPQTEIDKKYKAFKK
jgi:hypothetical protein